VAEQASAGLRTSAGELDAARWLDAEDATVHHVLVWAMEHDTATAARLAVALAPWWFVRGRWSFAYELLKTPAVHAARGGQDWCAAQYWLGMFSLGFDHRVSLGHFDAALAALIRPNGLSLRADSALGGRRQVSTVPPRTLESYRKIVPLPVTGRVDRCWDVVPARMGVSTVLLGR
jgi:hypothetical protein